MPARPLSRVAVASAAAIAIAGMMVFSATRSLAFPPQETVLTRAVAIDAINTGLTIDAIACSGATPAQVPLVLEAVLQTNDELQAAIGAAAACDVAKTAHNAAVTQIKQFGLTDELDSARAAAAAESAQERADFRAARQTWVDAMETELDGVLASSSVTRIANSTLNHSRAVPITMRVLGAVATDWEALEAAWVELDAVAVADLPDPLRSAWQTAVSDPAVVASTADFNANQQAIRTAFIQAVQQLPEE